MYATDGEACLGDVGAEHHSSTRASRRVEGCILFGKGEGSSEAQDINMWWHQWQQNIANAIYFADAWQKYQDIASVTLERIQNGRRDNIFKSIVSLPLYITNINRKTSSVACDDRSRSLRVGKKRRKFFSLRSCRHRQNTHVCIKSAPCVEKKRKPNIGWHIAFVNLVKDDKSNACKRWICVQSTSQDSFCEYFDLSVARNMSLVASLIANRLAHLFA